MTVENNPVGKRATIVVETTVKHFYNCPCCTTGRFSYGHLRERTDWSSVQWTCQDCGAVVRAEFDKDDRDKITLFDTGKIQKNYDTLVLLRYVGSTKEEPFYVVIQSKWHAHSQDRPLGETDEFFYNEHQCPWNYLRLPTLYCGDNDNHGLFLHVKTVLLPTDEQLQYILGDKYDDPNMMPDPSDGDEYLLHWVNHLRADEWERLFFPEYKDTDTKQIGAPLLRLTHD